MSQPKRYDFGMTVESCPTTGFHETRPWVYETEHGMYVKHADYAALQAEVGRLRKYWKATGEGVNRYVGKSIELEDKVSALQAENERLRKAGELMDRVAEDFKSIERSESGGSEIMFAVREWLAAKGVQP